MGKINLSLATLLLAMSLVACGQRTTVSALGTSDDNTPAELTDDAPNPAIHYVDADGNFVPAADQIEGVAPFAVNVSAFPPISEFPCFWDPTSWMAAGQYNLCSKPDPAHDDDNKNSPPAYHTGNLPASAAKKYVGAASGLVHPANAERGGVEACFYSPYDDATRALIQGIQNCVRDRDQRYNNQIARLYLAGGSITKTDFRWDFGDKPAAYNEVPGFNASHVFSKPGTYTITLNVRSQAGVAAEPRKMKVVVRANNRDLVAINSNADFSKLNGAKASANGRHIVFKRGVAFQTSQIITLYSNDWVSASDETGTLPVLRLVASADDTKWEHYAGKMFSGHGVNQVVVEDIEANASGQPGRPVFSTLEGSNVAYRNIVFNTIFKGFDGGGAGFLVQNVGAPRLADGTWQSNHLQSNFLIGGPQGGAFYGNHIYTERRDFNSEPQLRLNGGEMVSIYDNDMGGWAGKFNQTSLRGAKSVFISGNRMRGGVLNMQAGTSQNYQPAMLINNIVIERNTAENVTIDVGAGSFEVAIRNNISRLRQMESTRCECNVPCNPPAGTYQISSGNCDSDDDEKHGPSFTTDGFYASFPYPNVQQLTIEGGPVQETLFSKNISVVNNTFVGETGIGKLLYSDGGVQNLDIINNLFYSTTMSPLTIPTKDLSSLHRIVGNVYYLNAKTQISSIPASKTLAGWNAVALPSKIRIEDSLFSLSAFPMAINVGSDPMQYLQPKADAAFHDAAVNLFTKAGSDTAVVDTHGVLIDRAGQARPASGDWTAGALQAQ